MLSKQISGIVLPVFFCAGTCLSGAVVPPGEPANTNLKAQAQQAFSVIPGWFEPATHGSYVSRGHAGDVALTPSGMNMVVRAGLGKTPGVLPVSLPGAGILTWNGEKQLPGKTNYFVGTDRSKWRGDVPQFSSVRAASVWKGVDLVVYGRQKRLEYDFVVAPGAATQAIRMQFGKGWRASVQDGGDLEITDGIATVRQEKPVAWQERSGKRVEVASRFRLGDDGSVGFDVGAYDRSTPLVIDPVLAFSGFFGGESNDEINCVAAGVDGSYWLVGTTGSTISEVTGTTAYLAARAGYNDIFLAQIRPRSDGTPALTYFTYIGGASNDYPAAIAISPGGLIALTGTTYSTAFPTTTNGFQTTIGGDADAFVIEFDPLQGGTAAMLFSSFFGGAGFDYGTGVAFDASGNILVTGYTDASTLPVTGINASYQTTNAGGVDMFLLSVVPTGATTADTLLYSTFIGGNLTDIPQTLAVDAQGLIYIGGFTTSATFPMVGASYGTFLRGGGDGFLAVMDLTQDPLSQLVYSTYIGGDDLDALTGMVLDGNGGVWMTGYTLSNSFPVTSNAPQTAFTGYADAWLAHLDLTKSGADQLTYSTLYNGSLSTYGDFAMTMPYAVVLDSLGRPMIGGYTNCLDLPSMAPLPIDQTSASLSAFLATFDPAVSGNASVVFSTVFGGIGTNMVQALAHDTTGNIIVGGTTTASSFPVTDGTTKGNPTGAPTGFYLLLRPDPKP
ncbi:MAG: SBBP repeat-containing protein [Bryobacteraceae bacterium]|nr:SBBP repeat-containing protein [Bryobacteraceae bacterium]